MKTQILAMVVIFTALTTVNAQVGINTDLPGSTLTVSGSIAGQYKNVSVSTTLGIDDFYMSYNGASAATFTLPSATVAYPAAGNILGRVYYIKNTGAGNLTIAANGTELIDNQMGPGISSFTLTPGGYAMLISKGSTSGTTWEVSIVINKTITTIAALGADDTILFSGAALTNFNNGIPQVIPFSGSNLIVNQGGAATWNDANDSWDILEAGIYKIEALCYFGSVGAVSGTGSFTGININIMKGGSTIIGGNRANIDNSTASVGNSPIFVSAIIQLEAGDQIQLTMNWAALNKPTTSARIQTPASLTENRNFSLLQLSPL